MFLHFEQIKLQGSALGSVSPKVVSIRLNFVYSPGTYVKISRAYFACNKAA